MTLKTVIDRPSERDVSLYVAYSDDPKKEVILTHGSNKYRGYVRSIQDQRENGDGVIVSYAINFFGTCDINSNTNSCFSNKIIRVYPFDTTMRVENVTTVSSMPELLAPVRSLQASATSSSSFFPTFVLPRDWIATPLPKPQAAPPVPLPTSVDNPSEIAISRYVTLNDDPQKEVILTRGGSKYRGYVRSIQDQRENGDGVIVSYAINFFGTCDINSNTNSCFSNKIIHVYPFDTTMRVENVTTVSSMPELLAPVRSLQAEATSSSSFFPTFVLPRDWIATPLPKPQAAPPVPLPTSVDNPSEIAISRYVTLNDDPQKEVIFTRGGSKYRGYIRSIQDQHENGDGFIVSYTVHFFGTCSMNPNSRYSNQTIRVYPFDKTMCVENITTVSPVPEKNSKSQVVASVPLPKMVENPSESEIARFVTHTNDPEKEVILTLSNGKTYHGYIKNISNRFRNPDGSLARYTLKLSTPTVTTICIDPSIRLQSIRAIRMS